jgi:hypothetical protein
MALITPPSWLQAGTYTAQSDRQNQQAFYSSTGIIGSASLAVTAQASPNMTVNIAAGWGAIVSSTSNAGVYGVYNDATVIQSISTADATNPRIDLIVATVNDAQYSGALNNVVFTTVAGTPAASPSAPATPSNSLLLARVAVAAGASSISAANITDYRTAVSTNLLASNPGSNKLLNGDFGIWQRGTSISVTATGAYSADRWLNVFDGTAGTKTISQQTFTPGSAPVIGYESPYYLRVNQTVASAGQTAHGLTQRIEDVRSFAGQTVTLSFYAKAAAAFTRQISFTQAFGTGGSTTLQDVVTSPFTVGTTWARYSFTVAIPSVAGKTIGSDSFLEAVIGLPLNSTFTFDVWGVQVEIGSVATRFNTATGNPASELAACQRYFQRFDVTSGNIGSGVIQTLTTTYISLNFKTTLRKTPTLASSLAGNNVKVMNYAGTQFPVTAVSSQVSGTNNMLFLATTGTLTGPSIAVGQAAMFFVSAGTDYIEVNAEL